MNDPVETALRRLTRVTGVRGAMVVDAEAGVAVLSDLTDPSREGALAALTGSLFKRATDASSASGFGRLRTLQLESGAGHVVIAGAGPLLVVALTERGASLGLVRVETARAAGELSS